MTEPKRIIIPKIALTCYHIDGADRIGIQFLCRYRGEATDAIMFYDPYADRLWRWTAKNPGHERWEVRPVSDVSEKRGAKLKEFWDSHTEAIAALHQSIAARDTRDCRKKYRAAMAELTA